MGQPHKLLILCTKGQDYLEVLDHLPKEATVIAIGDTAEALQGKSIHSNMPGYLVQLECRLSEEGDWCMQVCLQSSWPRSLQQLWLVQVSHG